MGRVIKEKCSILKKVITRPSMGPFSLLSPIEKRKSYVGERRGKEKEGVTVIPRRKLLEDIKTLGITV